MRGTSAPLDKDKEIHEEIIVSKGVLEKGNILGTVLVDMYSKRGVIAKARVPDRLPSEDVTSWNVLIAGSYEPDYDKELHLFQEKHMKGILPVVRAVFDKMPVPDVANVSVCRPRI